MTLPISRRTLLKAALPLAVSPVLANPLRHAPPAGWVRGKLTGAQAVVETLLAEGTSCVFGIPGAQGNELWDTFKARHLPYLLVTHEFSAACMADGAARATGRPGVLCVVPGPGLTNAITGLGEALLDSVPVVCIAGDVARGEKFRPYQVHALDGAALLKPVTKGVFCVEHQAQIPEMIRQAFALASGGEPGPTAVVIPYNLLIETHTYDSPPIAPLPIPFDEAAFEAAVALLSDKRHRVGIYAGLGCMNCPDLLARTAEMLQAPVATSVSGKGCIPETHPWAVGWGYGPHATFTAEEIFKPRTIRPPGTGVDVLLAIGVRYSEVSTGFYGQPKTKHAIQVDINPANLGAVLKADVCVNAEAGMFLGRLLERADCLARPCDELTLARIRQLKDIEAKHNAKLVPTTCGVDPMAVVLALRCVLPAEALLYVDVTLSEHLAAEAFTVIHPRTFFNPANNQSMGWSIPAAIGGQRAFPGRPTVALVGDGCALMSAFEMSSAAREGLPVKWVVLDDHSYQYMQRLQKPAYRRTTATVLANLDYASLARGLGVGYVEIRSPAEVEAGLRTALATPGPVLVRVAIDYAERQVRWVEAVRKRYTNELSAGQKARFLARIAGRTLDHSPDND